MRSMTIKKCQVFNVDEELPIVKDTIPAGQIAPTERSYDLGGTIFKVFSCSYYLTINETIIVKDQIEGGFTTVDSYKKAKSFDAYYSSSKNLLFIDAPTGIAKSFIALLEKQFPTKIQTTLYNFDFQLIGELQNNAKAIYFAVDDDSIDSKIFFGNGVDQDDEAVEAIDNSQATYLMVEIDISGIARTVGFSKKGAIVLYNNPLDLGELENPYLQLAFDAVNLVANRH